LGVPLDPLHVVAVDGSGGDGVLDELVDAAHPEAGGVARVQVEEAAAGAQLVEGVVVQRRSYRVVVGVDHEVGGRIDDLRHLVERQDLERHGLTRLGILHGQPLMLQRVAAVTDEVRRDPPVGCLQQLEILPQRQLGAGEVGDVAVAVGVAPVL
jgi:hypothetical protein